MTADFRKNTLFYTLSHSFFNGSVIALVVKSLISIFCMEAAYPVIEGYRGISIVVGVLYLSAFVAGILSVAKAVDDTGYLTKAAPNSSKIQRSACFQFMMALFYLGIAITLYPLLKIYDETLAVGFLSFRIIAVLLVLGGTVILLMIVRLSQAYVHVGTQNRPFFNVAGDLLKTARDLVNHGAMIITLCLGGIMLYMILILSGLIPLWLSVWGLFGSLIAIVASILVVVNHVKVLSPTYLILNLPIALQEVVFAMWLIAVGFKQA